MNPWDAVIRDAIAKRSILVIRYDSWAAERAVEPHAYGAGDNGNDLLRAWQEAGASSSGEHSGWKLFTVSKIVSMRATGGTFPGARPGYARPDTAMRRAYAQL